MGGFTVGLKDINKTKNQIEVILTNHAICVIILVTMVIFALYGYCASGHIAILMVFRVVVQPCFNAPMKAWREGKNEGREVMEGRNSRGERKMAEGKKEERNELQLV